MAKNVVQTAAKGNKGEGWSIFGNFRTLTGTTLMVTAIGLCAPLATFASPPALSISDAVETEGNSGTKQMVFKVSLSAPTDQRVTVQYSTANGSALAGSDYVGASGTLSFAAGETNKRVSITIKGDLANESNEVFTVNLAHATIATITDDQGVGTITADDNVVVTLSISDAVEIEGNSGTKQMVFKVSLSAPTDQRVTVRYSTANGSALAGSDYVGSSGTLSFAAGEASKKISITIKGDLTTEPDEAFTVKLTSATIATIADAQGVGTITTDDGASKVVADLSENEGFGIDNYPNPFNPTTAIVYTLAEEAPVRLAIYNMLGQQIRVLVEANQGPGNFGMEWDSTDDLGYQVGAGIYFYRLEAGSRVVVGKMLSVR